MFGWAATLAIIAFVAAILGFGGAASVLANIAIAIFVIALVLSLIFAFLGWKAAKAIAKWPSRVYLYGTWESPATRR